MDTISSKRKEFKYVLGSENPVRPFHMSKKYGRSTVCSTVCSQAYNKENIKAPFYIPVVRGITGDSLGWFSLTFSTKIA